MLKRFMWSAALFVPLAASGCANDAASLTQPPSRPGLLGITTSQAPKAATRNGRKEIIYDADGRRDYRQDFKAEDGQKREFCRLHPGDQDCFNRRF